jgi:hypothetical protein
MELEDLKQAWKQPESNNLKNKNIMDIIQHKSYGPVAALKKTFRRQILLMAFIPVLLFTVNSDEPIKVLTSIMFWSYVAFCLAVIIFSWYNYRTVQKMEGMDGLVKTNLEKQIGVLEKRERMNLVGIRIALLYFVLLTEIIPYFQHYRMLDKWHSANLFIRYGFYAALFVMQYFLGRSTWDRKFGSHVKYLKELVKEME